MPTAELLLQKNVTMTGTLRAKKTDIPAVMEAAKGRELLPSKFIFSGGLAVVSYGYRFLLELGKKLTNPTLCGGQATQMVSSFQLSEILKLQQCMLRATLQLKAHH
jgi:hypothetical protein